MLVDPCYLRHWTAGEYHEEVSEPLNSYDEAMKLTSNEPWYGRIFDDSAVVAAPADGDGIYPVSGFFTEEGFLVKISILLGEEAVDPFDRPQWESRDQGYVLDPAEGKDLFLIGPEESEQTLPS
jgi:hypothetical protein